MAQKNVPPDEKSGGVVKKKPRGGNSPMIGENGLNLEPGDNAKYLGVSMQLMQMERVNLNDAQDVVGRLGEFFRIHIEHDMKPTVAGMSMALGVDRRRLWEIKTGNFGNTRGLSNLPPEVTDAIKKAYLLMENLWENYMQNGKINPMAGVFLGVNNFGYLDVKQVNLVPTPIDNSDNDYDADAIKQRYLIDSPTEDSTDD